MGYVIKGLNIYALLLFTILSGCDGGKTSKEIDKVINIGAYLNEGTSIPLSTIASKIEYICLEVSSESLFGNLDTDKGQAIEAAGDFYFVNDGRKLLSFDKEGKFIRQIGSQGRGPGEYIDISDFSVNEIDKEVAVLSNHIRKVLFYSFNGEFLRDFTIDFAPIGFTYFNGNLVFANLRGTRQFTDYYAIIVMDKDGHLLKRLIKRDEDIEMADEPGIVGNFRFFMVNNNLHYFESIGLDSIWTISEDFSIVEKKHLWYGKDRKPFSQYKTSMVLNRDFTAVDPYVIYERYLETENKIFIRLGNKGKLAHIVYDKETEQGETVLFEDKLTGRKRWAFFNDVDSLMYFWPDGAFPGNKVFRLINGDQIIELLKSMEKAGETLPVISKTLAAAMKKTFFNEMPILMVVTLNNNPQIAPLNK